MKQITLILLISIFPFDPIELPSGFDKKIDKELKSYFENQDISKEYIKIPENLNYSENSHLFAVKNENKTIAYMNINRVNACRIGGCSNGNNSGIERYDHFYYMALLDTNFTILKVKILDYQSEYGYEICGKNWLKQFNGKKGCDTDYGKNIDAISGATVSGNALVSEIQMLHGLLSQLKSDENLR